MPGRNYRIKRPWGKTFPAYPAIKNPPYNKEEENPSPTPSETGDKPVQNEGHHDR